MPSKLSVSAVVAIVKTDLTGKRRIHARKGETGRVEYVEGHWLCVTWDRTGVTCMTHVLDVKAAD